MAYEKLLTAITALRANQRVSLSYHGEPRLVEIHAVGLSKKGNTCLRVFQVIGGSVYSETTGWKLIKLDEAEDLKILDDQSLAPRPGYSPGDKDMTQILAEIDSHGTTEETTPP